MAIIRNAKELTSAGRSDLRLAAIEIANAGLEALNPDHSVRRLVRREGDTFNVDGRVYDLNKEVHLLGAGKATMALARAVKDELGDHLTGGLVVVPDGHHDQLDGIEVLVGDHPIPGNRSTAAGARMIEYAATVKPGALVICLFTGGSSALVSSAPPGVPVDAKKDLHAVLVASGLDVVRMNTVRKHVSAIKGGRLAQMLSGHEILNLTVSDVAGDILDAITDLTVQDTTTRADAIDVLVDAGVWLDLDASIRSHLESEDAESPWLDDHTIHTVLVTNGQTACDAMAAKAGDLGLNAKVVSTSWDGEATDFGTQLARLARESTNTAFVGCGGETTVRLGGWGSAGKGGPNQELAVATGLALDGSGTAALVAIDTDGSDGATPSAGGLVDDQTHEIWTTAGIDARALLAAHESTRALEGIGQAVFTGHTLTNVNDLFVLVTGT